MAIKYTRTFVCDRCGKERVEKTSDKNVNWRGFPDGWEPIYLGDDEVLFCCECAQKHQFLSVVPGADEDRWWVVDDEQIKALAAGVPAEDIFV